MLDRTTHHSSVVEIFLHNISEGGLKLRYNHELMAERLDKILRPHNLAFKLPTIIMLPRSPKIM